MVIDINKERTARSRKELHAALAKLLKHLDTVGQAADIAGLNIADFNDIGHGVTRWLYCDDGSDADDFPGVDREQVERGLVLLSAFTHGATQALDDL